MINTLEQRQTNAEARIEELNNNTAKTRYRTSLSRLNYIACLPEEKTALVSEHDVVGYFYTSRKGDVALMVFTGKGNKPDIHSAYFTEEQRENAWKNICSNVQRNEERKTQRKVERTAPHTLEVGDILDSSWGYDQTNIDFYQVTEVTGKNTVKVREIGKTREESDHYTYENVSASKGHFLEQAKEMTKRVNGSNGIKISSFQYATPWDGKSKNQTALGYGH